MFLFSKINFRRILAICVLSISLLVGSALGISEGDRAFAEVVKSEAVGIPGEGSIDQAEYESAKENRREIQAEISKEAEENKDSESIAEKLNLEEIVPPAIKNTVSK
jgi:hypothetical protein